MFIMRFFLVKKNIQHFYSYFESPIRVKNVKFSNLSTTFFGDIDGKATILKSCLKHKFTSQDFLIFFFDYNKYHII